MRKYNQYSLARHCENGEPGIILLDFARAFDKVSHRVLMSKVSSIGTSGELLAGLRDFLSNRTQFVFYQAAPC